MNNKMPRTPFSTPLSGSARETEIRLKNIFSGPKKRPPILFLALMFSVCLFCGNLVSCQVAEPEVPGGSIPEPPDASDSVPSEEDWQPVILENRIVHGSFYGCSETIRNEPKYQVLMDIPADELPREAVDVYGATRQDYWRDMLLPVAYHEETDVTLYFAVNPDTMPNVSEGSLLMMSELTPIGVVLRYGDHAQFLDLRWGTNWKYSTNPWLAVEDFDGDGKPEAATSLGWGSGTGADAQCLYILDLETDNSADDLFLFLPPDHAIPDYSNLPLEIFANPERTAVRLISGDQELEVDITELEDRFDGRMEVGNVIRFYQEDGQIICELGVDFTRETLAYMASAYFPVIYRDGTYCLGPAVLLTDDLYTEWQELYQRSIS